MELSGNGVPYSCGKAYAYLETKHSDNNLRGPRVAGALRRLRRRIGVAIVWSPQLYISKGRTQGHPDDLVRNSLAQIEEVIDGVYSLPAILTLNHLSKRTQIHYHDLRRMVSHADYKRYRKFSIKKRSGGRRFIYIPEPTLMGLQRWINEYILKKVPAHKCSYAFSPGSSIIKCASRHTGAQWLIKIDIVSFFESVSEIQVFRVFKELGYQPLVAFELSRICTVPVGSFSQRRFLKAWRVNDENKTISSYAKEMLGYLPQGAPTSPILSNLVMRTLDSEIEMLAKKEGLVYSRYSDDMTFSTRGKEYTRKKAKIFIGKVEKILSVVGFKRHFKKTTVIPPGSRKIVLGLQVDGEKPTLRREFKDTLRQHIYYLEKHGAIEHAKKRNFDTVWGMKCHIRGLLDYARMVEPEYGSALIGRFNSIIWPV